METNFEKTFTVQESETAKAVRSGGLPVLSTPHMIAYMENTAMTLMEKGLSEEQTSVGIEINVQHLAPTAVNKEVYVKAELLENTKKVYTYKIEATVEGKLIGKAMHKRTIVDREQFMSSVD